MDLKTQRKLIFAEINALHDRSATGEDVTAELRKAGERLDNLGKSKHRVDVMDMEKVEVKKKPVKTPEDALADKLNRHAYRKWLSVAESNGIQRGTFSYRIRSGKSYKEAATLPLTQVQKNPWIEVAEKNGIKASTYYNRKHHGYSDEDAATLPLMVKQKSPWINVAIQNGISENTFRGRIYNGWAEEDAAVVPVHVSRETYYEMEESK